MNREQYHLLAIIMMSATLLLSCTQFPAVPDEEPLPAVKDSIIALSVGNRWIWRVQTFSQNGSGPTYFDSLKIDSVFTVGSDNWFFPGQPYEQLAFANRPDGIYYKAFSRGTTEPAFLYYKYPARVNDFYYAPQAMVSGSTVWIVDTIRTMTVLSTDTTITVPAGVFRCYLYFYYWTNGSFYSFEFLSPGVGWVRKDIYARTLDQTYFRQSSIELIQFLAEPTKPKSP